MCQAVASAGVGHGYGPVAGSHLVSPKTAPPVIHGPFRRAANRATPERAGERGIISVPAATLGESNARFGQGNSWHYFSHPHP